MSSSEPLKQFIQLPQQSRKISDESLDSGYVGSRQHSAVHVLDSRELAVIEENENETSSSSESQLILQKSSSPFFIGEAAVSSKTPTLQFTNFPDYPQTASEDSNPSSSNSSTPAGAKSSSSNHSRQHESGFQSKGESALRTTQEHCSHLADTEVSDERVISNETQSSQPSTAQLLESAIREILSSNGSQTPQDIVHILETAIQEVISSTETQSQPSSGWLLDSQPELIPSMTADQEEILKRTVKRNTSSFVERTHFEILLPFLFAKKLMHSDDCEMLANITTHKAKGNYFYTVILPRKGKSAYRRLYKCLKRETEHLGHKDLVELLDTALLKEQSPQSSSESSPTESNFNSTSPSASNFIASDSSPDERGNSSKSTLPDSALSKHKVSSHTSARRSNKSCCTVM